MSLAMLHYFYAEMTRRRIAKLFFFYFTALCQRSFRCLLIFGYSIKMKQKVD